MAEHVPTPWRVSQGTDPIVGGDYVEIMAANGAIVASVMDLPNRQALASRIVRCVNCHEELVEALRAAHSALHHHPGGDNRSEDDIVRATAALAHAEGREP